MKQVKLSITESYVSHWGYWQGVRELLQNAVDTKDYDVIFDIDAIKIISRGGKIPVNALLLGKTTKKDDESTIGKFGEGMKLGFLVLKRLGAKIVMNNEGDLWSPEMVMDETFGENVLAVNIEEAVLPKVEGTVEMTISGLPKEAITEVRSKFAPCQDREVVIENSRGKAYKKKGNHEVCHLFVKGIFVTEVKGRFKFDYDFMPAAFVLDRDRDTASNWEVKHEAARLIKDSPDILLLAELAAQNFDDLSEFRGEFSDYSRANRGSNYESDDPDGLSPFEDRAGQLFREKYGHESFPINSTWDAAKKRVAVIEITKAGWVPVEVKPALFVILENEYHVDENIEAMVNFKPLPFLEKFLNKHRRKMYSKAIRELESTITLLKAVQG